MLIYFLDLMVTQSCDREDVLERIARFAQWGFVTLCK